MTQEKLLEWCNENYDFEAQEWKSVDIPEEILDCVLTLEKQGWPKYENGWDADFVIDFIYDKIVRSKYWEITRIWLKESLKEEIDCLFS